MTRHPEHYVIAALIAASFALAGWSLSGLPSVWDAFVGVWPAGR
jgi:hypothetical protein